MLETGNYSIQALIHIIYKTMLDPSQMKLMRKDLHSNVKDSDVLQINNWKEIQKRHHQVKEFAAKKWHTFLRQS